MAGFSIVTDPLSTPNVRVRHNGGVFAIGDIVVKDRTSDAYDVTTWALSNATTLNLFGIAMEATTAASTTVLVKLIDNNQEWKCAATNATSTNHNYLRVPMTDAHTVNNDGADGTTTSDIFEQTGVASTTEVVGKFIKVGQAAA